MRRNVAKKNKVSEREWENLLRNADDRLAVLSQHAIVITQTIAEIERDLRRWPGNPDLVRMRGDFSHLLSTVTNDIANERQLRERVLWNWLNHPDKRADVGRRLN